MGIAAFNKNKALCNSQLDLTLRKKAVNCHISSTALCGAESWTVRNVDHEYVVSLEMLC
jgi:hypothetical protein